MKHTWRGHGWWVWSASCDVCRQTKLPNNVSRPAADWRGIRDEMTIELEKTMMAVRENLPIRCRP